MRILFDTETSFLGVGVIFLTFFSLFTLYPRKAKNLKQLSHNNLGFLTQRGTIIDLYRKRIREYSLVTN